MQKTDDSYSNAAFVDAFVDNAGDQLVYSQMLPRDIHHFRPPRFQTEANTPLNGG